jgi:yecA family protein
VFAGPVNADCVIISGKDLRKPLHLQLPGEGCALNETENVTYDGLQDALQATDADSGAAECHGVICGVICASCTSDPALWLDHLLGERNTDSAMAKSAQLLLTELYSESLLHLNDGDLGLVLLLPQDDTPLSLRSEALGEWCQGFLYGLALGGVREDGVRKGSVGEIMHDFYEISNTRFEHEVTDEDEEAAYAEIVEYVRMSVLLCHEELRPLQAPQRLQ